MNSHSNSERPGLYQPLHIALIFQFQFKLLTQAVMESTLPITAPYLCSLSYVSVLQTLLISEAFLSFPPLLKLLYTIVIQLDYFLTFCILSEDFQHAK